MTEEQRPDGITRRQALKRMAAAGAVAWAVPTVQTLNMARASAQVGSPPPGCVQFRVNPGGTCGNVNPINSCFDNSVTDDCAPFDSATANSGADWIICLKSGCTLQAGDSVSLSASGAEWCTPGETNDIGTWELPGYVVSGNCITVNRPRRTDNQELINISHVDLRVCCG
ncbi:MAG: hypothetical protein ACE14W_05850 [Candidatus Velamenicoccus archaeovorus]